VNNGIVEPIPEKLSAEIRRSSRRAALLSAGGALVVVSSIVYSYFSLINLRNVRDHLVYESATLSREADHARMAFREAQNDRDTLLSEIDNLRRAQTALLARSVELERQLREMSAELQARRVQIEGLRCALQSSRSAIEAFHQRDYRTAVDLYDDALACDPDNAYLLNLKAYSLFRLGRLTDAVAEQRKSIAVDQSFAWGYFDLARFLCATGDFDGAKTTINEAIRLRPGLAQIMRNDGEFQRLCRGNVPR
jgi:tetratricopeptide (TPR) repeat protein